MKRLIFPLILFSLFLFANCSTDNTPIYSLSTNVNPNETGTISPASGEYDEGTEVEITANANENRVFSEWKGDLSGNQNPTTIQMNEDKSVTAHFEKREYPLTVNTEGEGTVHESVIQLKSIDYPHGSVVQLEADPVEGWEFIEWRGDLEGSQNPQTLTVNEEKNVTAVFSRKVFSLNIEIDGNGSVSEELISGNQRGDGYEFESEIKMTANPNDEWRFKEWRGDLVSDKNPIRITIDENKNIIAEFEEFPDSPFAGGDGSEIHPFEIETLVQLQEIRNYTDQHFIQIADIDASETKSWNDGDGFNPIGDDVLSFSGSFNGNGYKISNLHINRRNEGRGGFVGLFGYLKNGRIENVILENINVTGSYPTGGLIGRIDNGEVHQIEISGTVNGDLWTGGLIGYNESSFISNINVSVNVSGVRNLGGLIGISWRGEIIDSHINNVSISGVGRNIGGLIGQNSYSKVSTSYSVGDVSGDRQIGGLIGLNRGRIYESYSDGSVSGKENIGGLIGENNENISYSYSHSEVEGDNKVGGLIGSNNESSILDQIYATGKTAGLTDVGGLIGVNAGDINASYWDVEATMQSNGVGRGNSNGAVGLSTNKMTGSSAEENMSAFDWENIWKTTSNYPILIFQEN